MGYTQQNQRLRQLATQQQHLLSRGRGKTTQHPAIDSLHSQIKQTTGVLERLTRATEGQGIKIAEIEGILRPQGGQLKLNQNEIKHIRKRLEDLESYGEARVSKTSQSLRLKLEVLEAQVQSIVSNQQTRQIELSIASEQEDDSEQEDLSSTDLEQDHLSSEDEAAQAVIQWFNRRHTDVENYYEPDDKVDDLLDGLSLYLGDYYSILNQFHWRLRNSLGKRAYISLSGCSPREKSIHNQFLKKLRSCDYLSFGRIIKDEDGHDYILANPYTRPDVQGFLDGGWFERFVYYKIVELLNSEGVEYQRLRNLKITYRDGQNAELDLFFLIDGNPLLVECKASSDCDMRQVVGYRDKLSLEASQVLLVSLNIDEAEAHLRSRNWKVGVANQATFLDYIRKIIPAEVGAQFQPAIQEPVIEVDNLSIQPAESSDSTDDDLESFFRGRGLNQAAEARESILLALIQFFESDHEAIKFNDLTKMLRNGTAIGRNKIVEVLNCLRYSDILRDENNKPVRGNVSRPIYNIASTRLKVLERKCIESYSDKVIQLFDPDFFGDESNRREFERLTKGQLPAKYKPNLDA
jgi:hypothetical protein